MHARRPSCLYSNGQEPRMWPHIHTYCQLHQCIAELWLIRPFAVSPPRRFAPWLFRPMACSPISITFIQRKTTVQQHYKSKSFPTNPKVKVNILLSTFDVQLQIYFYTEVQPFLNFDKIIISVVNSSKCVWTSQGAKEPGGESSKGRNGKGAKKPDTVVYLRAQNSIKLVALHSPALYGIDGVTPLRIWNILEEMSLPKILMHGRGAQDSTLPSSVIFNYELLTPTTQPVGRLSWPWCWL